MTERTPRDKTTREATSRTRTWAPPQVLPDPAPEDGYSYRWVRTSVLGQSDHTNVSMRLREGWEPVKAEDHPELMLMSDRNSEYAGNIEVGGLLLCKTSKENVEARNEYHQNMAARQLESVDNNYMRESDPRMPVLRPERTTRVSGGR